MLLVKNVTENLNLLRTIVFSLNLRDDFFMNIKYNQNILLVIFSI